LNTVKFSNSVSSDSVRIQLRQLAGRAEGVGIKLEVDQAAGAWLAAGGYDPEYGARPLRRVLQRELSDRLAVLLLDGTFHAGDTVLIGVANDQLSFQDRSRIRPESTSRAADVIHSPVDDLGVVRPGWRT